MTSELYVGLMSGTSMNGIDAVLAEFSGNRCRIISSASRPYPGPVREDLGRIVSSPGSATLPLIGALDVTIANEFAAAALMVLPKDATGRGQVAAIGSHGQTVIHRPDDTPPFTVQLGDPATIAVRTGVPVVGDFRRGDMALGGQGAPLVPVFHREIFTDDSSWLAVVNIGGIANVSILRPGGDAIAFDTGPGNTLLDGWIARTQGMTFDEGGHWAASGSVHPDLLTELLRDPYFLRTAPKSTGVEHFGLGWLDAALGRCSENISATDVQATLAELTARTIVDAVLAYPTVMPVTVAGGGARNDDLLTRLRRLLPGREVTTTARFGIEPELVEAAAFAWFARERLHGRPTNAPAVTGARARVSMGGLYLPPE